MHRSGFVQFLYDGPRVPGTYSSDVIIELIGQDGYWGTPTITLISQNTRVQLNSSQGSQQYILESYKC